MAISTIDSTQLKQLLAQNQTLDLIDVRTPAEHHAVHVEGVRLYPLNEFDPAKVQAQRPDSATGPTYVLCKSGGRARKAAQQLDAAGMEAAVIEGGTDACVAAGLPVKRGPGRGVISLERQVRIVAGLLVFTFTLLGAFVNPWLLIVPGFVGAGLTFAGITDFCGMAMILSRMPWNQACGSSNTCSTNTPS